MLQMQKHLVLLCVVLSHSPADELEYIEHLWPQFTDGEMTYTGG